MINVGIVYFSNTGVTGRLILAAKKKVEALGHQVVIHQIIGKEIVEGRFDNETLMESLHKCNAIIFGSPTYMGNVSAQFKAFADATSDFWQTQTWAGKVAAGITSGSGLNGDQSSTLQYFTTLASQHGMIWVGLDAPFSDSDKGVNRLGCHLGVVACSPDGSVNEVDIKSAGYLAHRVVSIANRLASSS